MRPILSIRSLAAAVGLTVASTLAWAWAPPAKKQTETPAAATSIVHSVYFTLADSTPENRAKLQAGCDQYLSKHPGTLYYAAGAVSDIEGKYNDRDFDIGLCLVFADRESYDKYHASEDHTKFVTECLPLISKVRVFDAAGPK